MRRHRQIALLGFPGVGKSSIAHHFVFNQFYDGYDPNIRTNLQHQCVIEGHDYDLKIVDNAGSDQYTLNHGEFENSDAYILVYAIDDRQSFAMVSRIREKIVSTSTLTRIPIVLVGNKIDRKDERVVSTEEGRMLAREWRAHFVEASAKNMEAVQEIFRKSILAMEHSDENGVDHSTESIVKPVDSSNVHHVESKKVSSSKHQSSSSKQCLLS
jgi:small GTP-binding protein